jgi:hypothetical protein
MFRYLVVDVSRSDEKKRDDFLWEQGRSGWELVQVLEGSTKDASDRSMITLFFKRSATEDIGV